MASTSSTEGLSPAWWSMRCERNHAWWRLLPGAFEPTREDLICPTDGTTAVTAGRRKLADRVRLSLIPAAWEYERAIGFGNEYFIEIADHDGSHLLRSARTFEFDEACKRLAWFKGLTWQDAERRWDRSGLRKEDPLKMASKAMEETHPNRSPGS
jgi:hypothetical protein